MNVNCKQHKGWGSVLSHVRLFATLCAVACQIPLSMKISRQEYWSGLPFPTSGHLPHPGIKPVSCISCIGRWILYHFVIWEAQWQGDRYYSSFYFPQ